MGRVQRADSKEFDDTLWRFTIDKVVIEANGDVRFFFYRDKREGIADKLNNPVGTKYLRPNYL